MFLDFVSHRRGDATIWVDRNYVDQDFLERLADADELFAEPSCQIIKDQRKVTVGRLTVPIAGRRRVVYLKRYNSFSVRHRLVSPFIQSGAVRSLRGTAILREAKIPTIVPVAVVENRRRGALSKSFFISEAVAGGKTADDYWRENLQKSSTRRAFGLRRRFLARLAGLFQSLHAGGIYHNDLKDANILVVGTQDGPRIRIYLLDLEGVKRVARLSAGRKVKNLVQINRTLGRYLARSEKLFFLKCYLGPSFAERNTRRRWIDKILTESQRVDGLKARRASEGIESGKERHR